jgi:microcompartment protein CcmL/EutN
LEKQSLGLIETVGYVPAVEAADTGTKAANVTLLGYGNVDAGLITIKFLGDVGAVKAAVKAAAAAAQRVGKVVSVHVIPRPDRQLNIGPPQGAPPPGEKGPGEVPPPPHGPQEDETGAGKTAPAEEKQAGEASGVKPPLTAEPEGQPPAATVEEKAIKATGKKSGGRKKKG